MQQNYLCLDKDAKIVMQGTDSSSSEKKLLIKIDYCNQTTLDSLYPGKLCKSKKEANPLIVMTRVAAAIQTSKFNDKIFNANPIETSINTDILFKMK